MCKVKDKVIDGTFYQEPTSKIIKNMWDMPKVKRVTHDHPNWNNWRNYDAFIYDRTDDHRETYGYPY